MKTIMWLVTGLVAHSLVPTAQAFPTNYHGFYKPGTVAAAYKPSPPVYHVPPPPRLPPVTY